jgi:hypothetical protein
MIDYLKTQENISNDETKTERMCLDCSQMVSRDVIVH